MSIRSGTTPLARLRPLYVAVGVLSAVLVACSKPPVPKLPEAAPGATETAPPPAKCESLSEKCEGASGKKARIARTSLTFEPVGGWMFSQEEDATVVQASDSGPAVAAAGYDTGDAKQEAAARDAALEALAKKLSVTPPKQRIAWKKPLEVKDVGALKISLWQTEGAARGDKKGPLLVFSGPVGEGKAVLGIGFVPDDDSTNADASILQSIETIAPDTGAKP